MAFARGHHDAYSQMEPTGADHKEKRKAQLMAAFFATKVGQERQDWFYHLPPADRTMIQQQVGTI